MATRVATAEVTSPVTNTAINVSAAAVPVGSLPPRSITAGVIATSAHMHMSASLQLRNN